MKKIGLLVTLVAFLLCFPAFSNTAPAQTKGRLIVFTSEYCPYCKAFMSDVGKIYAKTKIGLTLPMTEVDNFSPPEEFEDLTWQIRYYPTFLILDSDDKEFARFRGYRGEEFFWGDIESVLEKMLNKK